VSGLDFMFCAPGLVFDGTKASALVFMFCVPILISRGTEGVRSRFHVLISQTHFLRYRGCRFPFSCFARPDSFSAVLRVPSPVFMFCAPIVVCGGTEGIRSRFHVLRSRTHFRRYQRRQVPFSCFALPDSFSAVPRASGPVFMFCAPDLFSVVLRASGPVLKFCARTHFWRYRGRQVPFSCFAHSDLFSAEPRVSAPVFIFCVLGLISRGTEGVGSCFHVLISQTHFWRYRGCRVSFSCFALSGTFSAVRRASGLNFMFCAPRLVFGGTEGVGSLLVFRARNRFRRYRGRRVLFSCFARPDLFPAVPRASVPVFMFYALGLDFGSTEGVGSRFHILRPRTRFRRYRGRQVPFSCFARSNSFSTVPRASGPVFIFLLSRTHFRRY
jgi:hypothetical protein